MLISFVLVLNFMNVLSQIARSDVTIDYSYDPDVPTASIKDIEALREDFAKCCKELKAQAIDQASLINDIRSIIKSEMESVKNQLYTDISNKIKEELIHVKSKQAENVNLVKYGISNLTLEVNSISKLTENMKNQLYEEFSNRIKEDLSDLKSQQNENINLIKITSDGLSNLTSKVKSMSEFTKSAVNEYISTTLDMNNEIKKIIPELNRTASNLESELSTGKQSDNIETITQNQKELSSSLNESLGAVYDQLGKMNIQILKNTNSFIKAHEEIKELHIKVNDIRNSSKETFHLANAFSEKETVYECAEYETFKTKIESSVVEVAKVCSNDDTVQRINDLKSKIISNKNILNDIQHSLKRRHNIQNTEGDISEQYRKLNDKLTTTMEDKLSKEYLIVKRDTVHSNICNNDKIITAVSKLGTNIKGEMQENKKTKKVLTAIRKMELSIKDNLLKPSSNGCNDTLKHQLDKVVQITSATNDLLTPKPLAKPCKNSKWKNTPGNMNVCKEVVKNRLCQGNLKLAFHCCKSCTRAKQLNKDGPHRYLNEPRRIDYFQVILS